MKKNLILTVVMFVILAIGIGVGRAFTQAEEAKGPAKSPTEGVDTHPKHTEPRTTKTEPQLVEPQNKPDQVPQPAVAELPVAQVSDIHSEPVRAQGDGLASLLYPGRRDLQENPLTEDGIVLLYTELLCEAKGNNSSAIDRHAELRSALERYIASRKAAKSETAALSPNNNPAQ